MLTEEHHKAYAEDLKNRAKSIGVGLGTTSPSVYDQELENEIFRKDLVYSFVRREFFSRQTAFLYPDEPPIPPGSTSITLKEIGLFDSRTIALLNDSLEDWSAGITSPSDNWTLVGAGASISRSADRYHNQYAAEITYGTELTQLYQALTATDYASKRITFQMAIKASIANTARVFIDDGVLAKAVSSYHPGDASYQLLKVTHTVAGSPTKLWVGIELTGSGSCLADWAKCWEQGKLLIRRTIDITKEENTPLAFAWESWIKEEEMAIYTAFDHEILTVGPTVVKFTESKYNPPGANPAQRAFIQIRNADIRFWYDSTDPSSTEGHIGRQGGGMELLGLDNIKNFRAIRATGTDAELIITYER